MQSGCSNVTCQNVLDYKFLNWYLLKCAWNVQKTDFCILTLSGRGGGESEARMTKLTTGNQKPLIL